MTENTCVPRPLMGKACLLVQLIGTQVPALSLPGFVNLDKSLNLPELLFPRE